MAVDMPFVWITPKNGVIHTPLDNASHCPHNTQPPLLILFVLKHKNKKAGEHLSPTLITVFYTFIPST